MVKTVIAEESLLDYLKSLCKDNFSSVGLIIGQSTKSTDYVIHLARTPEEREKGPENVISVKALIFNSVKEIQESVIADHAKHVTRMLPGGFDVLGIFICYPDDIFNHAAIESLKKLLLSLNKVLINEPFALKKNESEKLVLLYNPIKKKYVCKTLDVNNIYLSTFKQIDWKFQSSCMKWCHISTKFDMNWPSIGGKTSLQLKTQLENLLLEVNKLLEPAIVAINGHIQNVDCALESLIKTKVDKHSKNNDELDHLEACIFTLFQESSAAEDIVIVDCDVKLQLTGILRSEVFICQKGTIEETVNAVKQDIVRSLAARLEMHWDSLVEEEYGSPEEKQTIHEPPRRVSVAIPNSHISFTDYIFPDEGANEVISTFKELLDIDISEENVNKEYEIHGDPLDLYGKSDVDAISSSSEDLLNSTFPNSLLIAALSFAVILIGIAIALQIHKI